MMNSSKLRSLKDVTGFELSAWKGVNYMINFGCQSFFIIVFGPAQIQTAFFNSLQLINFLLVVIFNTFARSIVF